MGPIVYSMNCWSSPSSSSIKLSESACNAAGRASCGFVFRSEKGSDNAKSPVGELFPETVDGLRQFGAYENVGLSLELGASSGTGC